MLQQQQLCRGTHIRRRPATMQSGDTMDMTMVVIAEISATVNQQQQQ